MSLVVDTWAKVQAIENYRDVAGTLVFKRYVNMYLFGDIDHELGLETWKLKRSFFR